jgi:hypothetical protein
MWTPPHDAVVPPWVFSKEECIRGDRRMKSIIGNVVYLCEYPFFCLTACIRSYDVLGPAGTMRIQKVMKKGKGENTHDTLEWAFVYARWCWVGLGDRMYVENILEIFNLLNILTASTMKIETVRRS